MALVPGGMSENLRPTAAGPSLTAAAHSAPLSLDGTPPLPPVSLSAPSSAAPPSAAPTPSSPASSPAVFHGVQGGSALHSALSALRSSNGSGAGCRSSAQGGSAHNQHWHLHLHHYLASHSAQVALSARMVACDRAVESLRPPSDRLFDDPPRRRLRRPRGAGEGPGPPARGRPAAESAIAVQSAPAGDPAGRGRRPAPTAGAGGAQAVAGR